jgi:membrane protease YdiL (CAAX protease family)
MDDTTEEKTGRSLPFNNLYLISGLVHGTNRVWMYFFTITLVLFGYTGFQLVAFYPLRNILLANGYSDMDIAQDVGLIFNSAALKTDRNVVFLLELLMFVFAFLGFYIALRFVHNKTLTSVFTGYEKFRFRRFWFAFFLWGSMITLAIVGDYLLHPGDYRLSFNAGGMLVSLLIMVIFMPVQTGCEELLFRGYFLQGLALVFRNGIVPLILTSLLFALAHMTNPEVKEFGQPIMFSYYACFALFMGGITLLDEGLELAFGIHLANNLISSLLVSSPHSVIQTYSLFETPVEDPYSEIILWVIMAGITFVIFWRKYKWNNFNLLIR